MFLNVKKGGKIYKKIKTNGDKGEVDSMSQTKLFFLLLSLLLVFSLIPSVNATIEKEYEEEMRSPINPSSVNCAFKVRLVIETEQDGTWKTDSSYKLDFLLTVTFFNETHFEGDPLNFTKGAVEGEEFVYAYGDVTYFLDDYVPHLLVYSPTNRKMATIRFLPRSEGRVEIYPKLTIRDVKLHEGYVYAHSWGGQYGYAAVEPIYIDVKSPSATSPIILPTILSSELIFLVAGIINGVIVIGAIFMVKRRKEKFNPSER